MEILQKMQDLSSLLEKLKGARDIPEKLTILNKEKRVGQAQKNAFLNSFLSNLSPQRECILKQLIVLEQANIVFSPSSRKTASRDELEKLLDSLLEIDRFYEEIGGLIGYHFTILQFLESANKEQKGEKNLFFYPPQFADISQEGIEIRKAILWGIEHLPDLCELYPLGGAADRLHLQDPDTKAELPAAKLFFSGKTLLEWLLTDLQAREFLYYKIFGKEVITPIAMMTSHEKNNYEHILSICEKNSWFGRPKESIQIFLQPLVPTITDEGKWCMKESLQPLLKPSGHGAIWKLAKDYGVLKWFQEQKRKKALVRQINNPIAGIDYGLLAFTGLGCKGDKNFGFASCPRECGAAEGINVLMERKEDEGYAYTLSNIEYCDFGRYGICDEPRKAGDKYSKFSSNTNILFADLQAIEEAVQKRPFPGILINLKNVTFKSGKRTKEKKIARLESTMQNIADEFVENYSKQLPEDARNLDKTFITYNHRHKTISTAKKVYFPGKSTLETPERCFYDCLQNAHELLQTCGVEVPSLPTLEEYLEKGPSFLFRYHPALGPLYSLIQQKIVKGRLHQKAELVCEIAELSLENLDLKGSLLIRSLDITGHRDEKGFLHPSDQGGKCSLKNVRVENCGINEKKNNRFWKGDIHRKEAVSILLHGNAEFHAENITLKGNFSFDVPSGYRLCLMERDGKIHEEKTKISSPTWFWKHEISEDFQIRIKKQR